MRKDNFINLIDDDKRSYANFVQSDYYNLVTQFIGYNNTIIQYLIDFVDGNNLEITSEDDLEMIVNEIDNEQGNIVNWAMDCCNDSQLHAIEYLVDQKGDTRATEVLFYIMCWYGGMNFYDAEDLIDNCDYVNY